MKQLTTIGAPLPGTTVCGNLLHVCLPSANYTLKTIKTDWFVLVLQI
jgi:hypothetical protein